MTVYVLISALTIISKNLSCSRNSRRLYYIRLESDLPASFYRQEQDGWMGFTEKGFLYASDAIEKALGGEGRSEANSGTSRAAKHLVQNILEFHCGSVNHPAFIGDFSQFPNSPLQYLWNPIAFLEPAVSAGTGNEYLKITEGFVCNLIQVRVNSNFRTITINESVGHKKVTRYGNKNFIYLTAVLSLCISAHASELIS